MSLFEYNPLSKAPLAFRMRPGTLDEVIGQQHVIGPKSALRRAIERDELHSFVLYGPPGTGKTSIAQIIASVTNSHFEQLPAVTSGVGDIRKVAADAVQRFKYYQQHTLLFVDEIHRFNKSQQDVLLPFVEDGTLILAGATTENPLYELNNALLSRLKLYVLEALSSENIAAIINHALLDKERGLGRLNIAIVPAALEQIILTCKGDARMALNIIETAVNSFAEQDTLLIDEEIITRVIGRPMVKYDKSGDYHYDTISAFIKSIRGSDPHAALFWLAAMLEGGEDPRFIARRLIIHAAEDIGLADPFALTVAMSAAQALDYAGMPEARIPMAEATIYLCLAPKSNSSKIAIDKASATVREMSRITVPAHIADNSHSQASRLLKKGQGYKYPPDFDGYVEQSYLPDELSGLILYNPSGNGYEANLVEFMDKLPNLKNKR
ncbi:MAG: replication-associated recombination protein A [Syntrophomonadaceae bacterium]